MLENEKLDTLFSCFAAIVNPLKSLGKKLTEQDHVTKHLFALKGKHMDSKEANHRSYTKFEDHDF